MNPLFVGIDVSSKNNVTYLMNPDGSKHSSFSVQNNLGCLLYTSAPPSCRTAGLRRLTQKRTI